MQGLATTVDVATLKSHKHLPRVIPEGPSAKNGSTHWVKAEGLLQEGKLAGSGKVRGDLSLSDMRVGSALLDVGPHRLRAVQLRPVRVLLL